jgi:hypothetical protein
MLGRQRHTLHFPQIAPDRLHRRPPTTPCRAMMAMAQPVRNGRGRSRCDQAHQKVDLDQPWRSGARWRLLSRGNAP